MHDEYTETIEQTDTHRVLLVSDDSFDVESPREYSNLGVMWCRHDRYDLGEQGNTPDEWDELNDFIDLMLEWHVGQAVDEAVVKHLKRRGSTVVLPLYLYDHSGISMSAGTNLIEYLVDTRQERRAVFPWHGGWDTSYVGYLFDTPRTREECGTPADRIEEALRGEVEVYSSYLEGDVWGYRVEQKVTVHETRTDLDGNVISDEEEADWDEVDSCWGYIGHEWAEQAAKEALAHYTTA